MGARRISQASESLPLFTLREGTMRQSANEAFFSPELSDSIRTSRQRRVAADRERSGIMPKPLPASRDSHPFPGQASRVPPSLVEMLVMVLKNSASGA